MGKALRRGAADGGGGRGTVAARRPAHPTRAGRASAAACRRIAAWLGALAVLWLFPAAGRAQSGAPVRLDQGRFTVVSYPADARLAHSILATALAHDTFPGLPRPREHVLVAIAPDFATFRDWAGAGAPEWGAALAFPDTRRIVLQGSHAGAEAGDPLEVVRHELAHLALHEYLHRHIPRWFDEGYASYSAHEMTGHDAFAANLALALQGVPTLQQLEDYFNQGATTARAGYALAASAVAELAELDPRRGLSQLLADWRDTGSLDRALREAHGMTLDEFEADWRKRARQRYGALALMEDLTLLGIVLLVFVLPLWIARRRRDRARMAALQAADDVADARAREEALAELLGPWPAAGEGGAGNDNVKLP
jgi:Peptidase MA superfamily